MSMLMGVVASTGKKGIPKTSAFDIQLTRKVSNVLPFLIRAENAYSYSADGGATQHQPGGAALLSLDKSITTLHCWAPTMGLFNMGTGYTDGPSATTVEIVRWDNCTTLSKFIYKSKSIESLKLGYMPNLLITDLMAAGAAALVTFDPGDYDALKKVTSARNMFSSAASLANIPKLVMPECLILAQLYNRTAIVHMGDIDFPKATDMSMMFSGTALETVGNMVIPAGCNIRSIFNYAPKLRCIKSITPTLTSNRDRMFSRVAALNAPNATEQANIIATGVGYTNPSACP